MRWIGLCFLALAACNGGDTDDGSMCSLGEQDCGCHPALATGCNEGLVCDTDNVCVADDEMDSDTDTSM